MEYWYNNIIFKPITLIQRKGIPSKFNRIPKALIYSYFLKFIPIEELKQIIKLNILFHNCVFEYQKSWNFTFNSISHYYNFIYRNNQVGLTKEQTIKLGELFKVNNDEGHYIKIVPQGVEHYGIFHEEQWAWKNDTRYWRKSSYPNSLLGGPTYYLLSVCWVDPRLSLYYIKAGNYQLFIRHGFNGLRKEILMLTVLVDEVEVYRKKYPQIQMIQLYQSAKLREGGKEILMDSLIVEINEKEFNQEIDKHQVEVKIDHHEGSWKRGWMIDGIILKPI